MYNDLDDRAILDIIRKALKPGIADSIVLLEENPLDPATPQDRPLTVVGWGMGNKNSTYPALPGWDQIREDGDEYFIVADAGRDAAGRYVIRATTEHSRRYVYSAEHLLDLAVEIAGDLGLDIDQCGGCGDFESPTSGPEHLCDECLERDGDLLDRFGLDGGAL